MAFDILLELLERFFKFLFRVEIECRIMVVLRLP